MKKDTKTNKYKEIQKENAIKEHLDCNFIRINPDEKDFDVYVKMGKIYYHINISPKKSLINSIARRLSELEFKSNHLIKSDCLNYVVKKILPSL